MRLGFEVEVWVEVRAGDVIGIGVEVGIRVWAEVVFEVGI